MTPADRPADSPSAPARRRSAASAGALALLAVLAVLFVLVAARAAAQPASDMDAWWLAATGRVIAATHAFPRTNLFSFTEPDHPWILHEWLFAAVYAAGVERFGPAFLAFFGFVAACATSAVALVAILGRARHLPTALLLCAVPLATFARLDSPRPLYASVIFAVALVALAFTPRFSRAQLLAAVATELVWANAHGSFPLGLALLGGAALASHDDRPRRLLALLLAALATLLNPYGARIYAIVARYAVDADDGSAIIRSNLQGMAPLWRAGAHGRDGALFVDPGLLLAFAVLAIAGGATLLARRHVVRALASLGLLTEALLHVRHLVLALLVASVLLAPAIDERFAAWAEGHAAKGAPCGTAAPRRASAPRLVATMLLPAALVGLALFALAAGVRPENAWIAPSLGGDAVPLLVARLPPGARLHVQFPLSGLALWFGGPRGVRVLYDSRNDCYSPPLIAAGLAMGNNALTADETASVLDHYGADYVLLDPRSYPEVPPVASDAWRPLGQTSALTLFERAPTGGQPGP